MAIQNTVAEEARLVSIRDDKENLRVDIAKRMTEMVGLDPDNPKAYDADKVLNSDEMLRYSQLDVTHNQLRNEIKDIDAQLDKIRKFKPASTPVREGEPKDVMVRWMRSGNNGLTSEEAREQDELIRSFGPTPGGGKKFVVPLRAILTSGSEANLIDETTSQSVVRGMHAYGGAVQAFSVVSTPDGNKIEYPVYDDIYPTSYSVVAERGKPKRAQPVTAADSNLDARQKRAQVENPIEDFFVRDIEAFPRNTGFVDLSKYLQEDVRWDVGNFIEGILRERMGRSIERDLTRGNGNALTPTGLETRAGSMTTASDSETLDWRELVKLIHDVEAGYIRPMVGLYGFPEAVPGKIGFMTSWKFLGAIKQLQDTQNRPLVIPNIQDGGLDSIMGYPVFINYEMTHTDLAAAGNKPIYFGNFGYMMARFAGAALMIEEHYDSTTALTNTNRYMGRMRYDSECISTLSGGNTGTTSAFKALSRKT